MTIHEFGKNNETVVVLIHPSLVRWDYFENVIPLLQEKYHLIVPALPGYDESEKNDFTSVGQIAAELEDRLLENSGKDIACVYGCSMGGAVVIRMLADNRLDIHGAAIDGGITPYQLPWLFTRFIAIRDYLMIRLGKSGGVKLLEKAFAADEYSSEDLQYVAGVLRSMSNRKIWRTFESCNNYSMPKRPKVINTNCRSIEYWFADKEEKERKWDIAYIKKRFPTARFRMFENLGHAGLALLRPELLAEGIDRLCRE